MQVRVKLCCAKFKTISIFKFTKYARCFDISISSINTAKTIKAMERRSVWCYEEVSGRSTRKCMKVSGKRQSGVGLLLQYCKVCMRSFVSKSETKRCVAFTEVRIQPLNLESQEFNLGNSGNCCKIQVGNFELKSQLPEY